jgi:hypothetical protein
VPLIGDESEESREELKQYPEKVTIEENDGQLV